MINSAQSIYLPQADWKLESFNSAVKNKKLQNSLGAEREDKSYTGS